MNKSNKILLGILSFVVVCVVGYALFSENITVTGTATASGTFDIARSCQVGVPSELVNAIKTMHVRDYKEGGYKNDSCSIVGDEAIIAVELEYPTAERWFTIKVTNNGTIPAVLSEIILKKSELCTEEGCTNFLDSTEEQQRIVGLFTKENNYILGAQIGDSEIMGFDVMTDDIMKEFTNDKGEQILKPGNSVYFGVRARFNSTLGYDRPGDLEYTHKVVYEYIANQITE